MEDRSQRPQEELHQAGRGLAGRLQEILLRQDWERPRKLRRYQRQEEAKRRPAVQEFQVVPGHHLPRALHTRGRHRQRGDQEHAGGPRHSHVY